MKEIRINKEQWNSISVENQQQVISFLIEEGILEKGDTVVGDPEVSPINIEKKDRPTSPALSECWDRCDIAYTACIVGCIASPSPLGCEEGCDKLLSRCRDKCLG